MRKRCSDAVLTSLPVEIDVKVFALRRRKCALLGEGGGGGGGSDVVSRKRRREHARVELFANRDARGSSGTLIKNVAIKMIDSRRPINARQFPIRRP